jgi:hypothetical protein
MIGHFSRSLAVHASIRQGMGKRLARRVCVCWVFVSVCVCCVCVCVCVCGGQGPGPGQVHCKRAMLGWVDLQQTMASLYVCMYVCMVQPPLENGRPSVPHLLEHAKCQHARSCTTVHSGLVIYRLPVIAARLRQACPCREGE